MQTYTLLSIIVPIYNAEQYLPKCVESIINQSYKKLEIFLVDDGSTDKCPEICDKYAQIDKRIKVIHKKNEGLVRARKTALDVAEGDYIAFVDDDDWIEPDMYLKLMEDLETSGADFVDSGYFCDKDGISWEERKLKRQLYELDEYTKHAFFRALLCLDDLYDLSHQVWCRIFKKDIIKECYGKVPDALQHGEDAVAMAYCILKAKRILQVEDVFYHHIYREESMAHLKSASYVRKMFESLFFYGNIILDNDRLMRREDIDKGFFLRMYFSFQHLLDNEFDVIQYYSFSNIEELFGKRIVIYGAGRVGKDYITQISKYEKCEIVCWVDKAHEQIHVPYREVVDVGELFKRIYDIVLIAVEKKEIAEEIRQTLLKKGIRDNKILWYQPKTLF